MLSTKREGEADRTVKDLSWALADSRLQQLPHLDRESAKLAVHRIDGGLAKAILATKAMVNHRRAYVCVGGEFSEGNSVDAPRSEHLKSAVKDSLLCGSGVCIHWPWHGLLLTGRLTNCKAKFEHASENGQWLEDHSKTSGCH